MNGQEVKSIILCSLLIIHVAYGEIAVDNFICCTWFRKFCVNDFNLRDASCSGQLTDVDGNKILPLTESDQHIK